MGRSSKAFSLYLLNRLPTKAMGSRTPFEAWCGRKPQLGHVRIFGCGANVRPAVPHLKKLDDRSVPMVYLGVEDMAVKHIDCMIHKPRKLSSVLM